MLNKPDDTHPPNFAREWAKQSKDEARKQPGSAEKGPIRGPWEVLLAWFCEQ